MKLRNLLLSVLPFVVSTLALAQMPVGTAKQQITDRLNLSAIADPASPAAGDLWRSSTSADKLKYRSGGTTYTLVTESAAAALYQPLDSDLTAIAALSTTSFGRGLLTQADASAASSTLGLVIGTDVQAYSAALASWAGVSRAAGLDTFAATPSSANLRSLVSDETGTGALYFSGGALGTPSSATLTNATGLPLSTGVSGLGTGVATALAATPNATGGVLTYTGNLGALAGLSSASDTLPYFTGSGTAALATFTSFGRSLVDDSDAATARSTLGLGSADSVTFSSLSLTASTASTSTTTGALVVAGGIGAGGNANFGGTLGASGNVWSGNNGFSVTSGTTDGAYLVGLGQLVVSTDNGTTQYLRRRSSDGNLLEFYRDTTPVGGVAVTTTSTMFITSSDSRLKTNIRDLTGSGAIIDALRPRIFDWRSGKPDDKGFVAQELFAAYPLAVTKGDDDPAEIHQQWQVDNSKLVPVLTAEIKDLRRRVAAIEADQFGACVPIAVAGWLAALLLSLASFVYCISTRKSA